jgi:hypothetical protein
VLKKMDGERLPVQDAASTPYGIAGARFHRALHDDGITPTDGRRHARRGYHEHARSEESAV